MSVRVKVGRRFYFPQWDESPGPTLEILQRDAAPLLAAEAIEELEKTYQRGVRGAALQTLLDVSQGRLQDVATTHPRYSDLAERLRVVSRLIWLEE